MDDHKVLARMRADWNERAGEDAFYYVAFGRRDQDEEEFFATAADVVRLLEWEFKRLPGRAAALEIGCGPGRLMRPMSRHFAEIHGVDVSDEMIRMARGRLANTPNAYPRHGSGSDLAMFESDKFDFVYSYAVFQHIPSRDVVFQYLREAWRVLKPGGILRFQVNGLPQHARQYDTWSGVRIAHQEIQEFTRKQNFHLLALENIWTQYMWVTCRKPTNQLPSRVGPPAVIRNIGNARTGEAVAPVSGVMAALSIWIEGLPPDCDINSLGITADGLACRLTFIGAPERDGVTQVNAALPEGLRTGLVPVEAFQLGESICAPGWVQIMPAGPSVARVQSVTDGINLLSGTRIITGSVKVSMSDLRRPEEFRAAVNGVAMPDIDMFCTDPIAQNYEFNFTLPATLENGAHILEISLGARVVSRVGMEVAR